MDTNVNIGKTTADAGTCIHIKQYTIYVYREN